MPANLNWLLETATAGAEATGSLSFLETLPSLLVPVAMIGLLYFLIIRPQRKKDKAVKDMLSAIKVGDRICTIGGIYGTISALKDDTVTLVVGAPKTPMIFARWAIRSVENAPLENDAEPQV